MPRTSATPPRPPKKPLVAYERHYAPDRAGWRRWLTANHRASSGVWLVLDKLVANKNRLTYEASVEEALCFGWVDSRGNKLDERQYLLLFAPRNPKSAWSKINKRRIEELTAAKKMRPAGTAMVELAKKSGTWTALDQIEEAIEPADLKNAFAKNKPARAFWDAFPPSARKGILQWIISAKKPETRAKRIEETVRLAGDNVRANQWRPK